MQFQKLKYWKQPRLKALKRPASTGPIGLDFGMERINLVQFEKRVDNKNIVAAASIPYLKERDEILSSKNELRFFINRALKTQPFRGRDVVAALPPNMFQLVHVNYKINRNEDQNSALIKAIKDRFSERLENAVIDYLPIRPKVEDQIDRTALVAISEHRALINFLETLRGARLKVKALEVGSVAIKRLLSSLHEDGDSQQKIMAINFATNKSFVTVLWGGELLLDREVSIGLDCLLDAISESLEIPSDKAQQMLETYGLPEIDTQSSFGNSDHFSEDLSSTFSHILKPNFINLTNEIKKIMIYTAAETQGGAIDAVYLLGSVARWPGADKYLSKLIKLPVVTIDPLFGYFLNDAAIKGRELEPVSGIAVATGLALRGMN